MEHSIVWKPCTYATSTLMPFCNDVTRDPQEFVGICAYRYEARSYVVHTIPCYRSRSHGCVETLFDIVFPDSGEV